MQKECRRDRRGQKGTEGQKECRRAAEGAESTFPLTVAGSGCCPGTLPPAGSVARRTACPVPAARGTAAGPILQAVA